MPVGVLNQLLAAMPPMVAQELMESGGDFCVRDGGLLPKCSCDGSQLFIITEGVAALLTRSLTDRSTAIGLIGREGILPIAGLLNVPTTQASFLAISGTLAGRRVRTKDFWRIVGASKAAREVVNRFIYAQMVQSVGNMLAYELPIGARLARCLLMLDERVDGDRIEITHDRLALLLQTHRPTITAELRRLRDEGMIDTCRAAILIRERDRLRTESLGAFGGAWSVLVQPEPASAAQLAA